MRVEITTDIEMQAGNAAEVGAFADRIRDFVKQDPLFVESLRLSRIGTRINQNYGERS